MQTHNHALSSARILMLAIICCIVVANIYFNQSVLNLIAGAFPNERNAVSLIPMATQLGYAAGLFFLIPLGDYIERQRLILRQAQVLFLALLGMMLSPTATVLVFFSFITGMSATVAQQIVPLAASLAGPSSRGKTVGTVMSGVLAGILAGRAIGGLIGQYFDWRGVFLFGALMTLLAVVFIVRILPSQSLPAPTFNYLAVLRSLGQLWKSEPQVRKATLTQAMLFASFSVLWTVLPFWLAHRYDYGAGVTGTLAALGLIGILCAPLAGSFSDRQGPFRMVMLGVILMLLAWIVFWGWNSMAGMVVGILLLDAGEQCVLIANQHTIYALRPDARNRLNTLFMCVMFIGGACGSLTATGLWQATQSWTLISAAGAALVLSGMLIAVRRKD
ncbi:MULTISPECIES: MFS transporter [Phytobacter]|jgi:predicted MFS family arabinose efflux permease|uniref:MFS transporter n=1 Tax=Phytobacter diazotrophicus TaxID=395631 RepID=A0ABM7VWI3_9ENTR|nr:MULTISPECIES: MFS transporter [Phytobacter]MDU4150136.1 MFS transporter [Enterobacteriaceae bacterium]PXW61021.1 putative MFS family arabinose efflux permease [Grimontella sp. AG753]MDU4996606.1 MFS transporter [Enterobacteriaceae bacterium]MDU7376852.1 MFS transporter [Enterobacteriaceae bacterium]TCW50541.1 putative MFS family arabinose efflux permease [Phytobacter diazotrophicus]